MAYGKNIRTYFEGAWREGNAYVMRAADHGSWLGSTVFDGARYFEGIAPDLHAHCQRLINSAESMGITPLHAAEELVEISMEGVRAYGPDAAVYIRPMYWALDGGHMAVLPKEGSTGFCICLEEVAMPPSSAAVTLTTTRFHRPILASSIVNAKSGCLYPNNGRMLREAKEKGFDSALAADALGNVAETATSNVFIVKDGVVSTPIANGTFLAGVTRARIIELLRSAGYVVQETVLSFDDVHDADEVFLTGNMSKVVPVSQFDETHYQRGPIAAKARELYWEWAHSAD